MTLDCVVINQEGKTVVTGTSTIIAPSLSVEHELLVLGEVAAPAAPNAQFEALMK